MNFWDKYHKTTKQNESYVCLGLDPHIELFPKHLLSAVNPLFQFNKQIVEATHNKVAAYKLNYAFYISAGIEGLNALVKTIELIPDDILVILDVKVGDIANTMEHYAKGYFEYMKVDAVTVNPLMGEDVITPLLKYQDKFFFVLALTSNRSSSDFLKKNSLYEDISAKINGWGYKNVGAVVGATNKEELKNVRSLMPKTLFLVPGIGAQGGSLSDVMTNTIVSVEEPSLLINSSRGIIHKSNGIDFDKAAAQETEVLRNEINSYLK